MYKVFAALFFLSSISVNGALLWKKTDLEIKQSMNDPQSYLGRELNNIDQLVVEDFKKHPELAVVSKIEREGVLSTAPKYHESDAAISDMSVLFRFSVCARFAESKLANPCKVSAEKALIHWAKVYIPTGNPINESQFGIVFISADLMLPLLSPENQKVVLKWVNEFLKASDSYLDHKDQSSTTRINNHNTWRLFIRSLAAKILNDSELNSQNKKLISEQVFQDLLPPKGWKPDSNCPNNFKEKNYGSFDFRQRDALHYHEYNLEAWSLMALLVPENFDQTGLKAVKDSVSFMKPYFLGEKEHIEFVCSKINFDLERKKAGITEYQNHTWNRKGARKMLRLARTTFPEIRQWTQSVVDEEYDQWIKIIVSIQEK